jgi:hypothetical protein
MQFVGLDVGDVQILERLHVGDGPITDFGEQLGDGVLTDVEDALAGTLRHALAQAMKHTDAQVLWLPVHGVEPARAMTNV